MMAGMVLANLLYVAGAIVAATVVSGVVLLRHRRPKSLESSIEMFSRELKALQPERSGSGPTIWKTVTNIQADPAGKSPVTGDAAGDPAGSPDGGGRSRLGLPRLGATGVGAPGAGGARGVVRLGPVKARAAAGPTYGESGSDGAGTSSPEQESEPG